MGELRPDQHHCSSRVGRIRMMLREDSNEPVSLESVMSHCGNTLDSELLFQTGTFLMHKFKQETSEKPLTAF